MRGYFVSVPLPWNPDGALSESQFRAAIHKLLGEGCDGIYLFGTSGEGYALTDDEFRQIVDVFEKESAQFSGLRQVSCFGLSSDQVKQRCQIVADHGLESVQITLPFWKELNDKELKCYIEDVCGSFPGLSFLLYNNPRNKRRLKGKELEALHQTAPNLCGVKTGSGNWFDFFELITESPSLEHFVTESAFLFCNKLGAAGLIPSSNYVFPKQAQAYYDAVITNDLETAHRLHREIMRFFHKTAIPLLQKGYIDGAIDKAYARLGGMDIPLNMKSPYIPLSKDDFQWLETMVKQDWANEWV